MKKFINIILVFLISSGSIFISACEAADVNEAGIIELMAELKVINGDPNGDLRLNSNVTRAEFTKMVVNASEYKNIVALNQPTSTFKDVLYTHWAAPYIRIGAVKKIINGYSDASFRPENNVLLEEALNISLKLLGYTSEDFGASWPYGQVGLSENIGLCHNVQAKMGEMITRRDAMNIIYNTLNSYKKNSNEKYISSLKYQIIDDVVLIATNKEDVSVGSDKIYTTSGYFKISDSFSLNNIGRRGTLIIKNNDEAVSFIGEEQNENIYSIYQILNDDIIVFENGNMKTLDVGADLTVYYKTEKHMLSSLSQKVSMGDVIKIYKNKRGVYDYGVVAGNSLIGPITVKSGNWLSQINMNENATILKNGSKVSYDAISLNDIIYYSHSLNTVMAYNKRVTGVYEKSIPTKDNPTSVTVSGITYEIEGSDAFTALSSNGAFNIGDTVTLLMGRTGNEVADVLSDFSSSQTVYGYLIETGIKEYSSNVGNEYNSYYVKIVDAGGNKLEFPVSADYSHYINNVISVTTKKSGATISAKAFETQVSGTVSYKNKKIGNYKVSDDIKILDVAEPTNNKAVSYVSTYLQNLDGYTLNKSDILYLGKTSSGEINELILKDVTGEAYSYGIVTRENNNDASSFNVDLYGTNTNVSISTIYDINRGSAVKILKSGGGVSSVNQLQIAGKTASDLTETEVTVSNKKYKISSKTAVYKYSNTNGYIYTTLSEIIENKDDYYITVYGESLRSHGNRAWVIVAEKK